jgi:hypothetical protein
MRTYVELFAGGGMARAGLGVSWQCLFASDLSRRALPIATTTVRANSRFVTSPVSRQRIFPGA